MALLGACWFSLFIVAALGLNSSAAQDYIYTQEQRERTEGKKKEERTTYTIYYLTICS